MERGNRVAWDLHRESHRAMVPGVREDREMSRKERILWAQAVQYWWGDAMLALNQSETLAHWEEYDFAVDLLLTLKYGF
jgi:hypothetical protein